MYSEFKDFEDAVQYYAAEYNDIEAIVTRNAKDYQQSVIPVVNAQEFLETYF